MNLQDPHFLFYQDAHITYLLDHLKYGISQFTKVSNSLSGSVKDKQFNSQHYENLTDEQVHQWFTFKSQEHSIISGIYWLLGSLSLLSNYQQVQDDRMIRQNSDVFIELIANYQQDLIIIIKSCYCSNIGGYKTSPFGIGPDSILATMNAVQTLQLLKQNESINTPDIIHYVLSLQDEITGAFFMSQTRSWNSEVDLRLSLCALVTLYHLLLNVQSKENDITQTLPMSSIEKLFINDRKDKLIQWILNCQAEDGGFGNRPGNESHAGYTYCAISCLDLLGSLHTLNCSDRLSRVIWFLTCRLIDNNSCSFGLHNTTEVNSNTEQNKNPIFTNGRPGKPEDVCYSWWVLASIIILFRSFPTTLMNGQSNTSSDLTTTKTLINLKNDDFLKLNLFDKTLLSQNYIERFIQGILKFQHRNGGFSRVPFHEKQFVESSISLLMTPGGNQKNLQEKLSDPYHTFFALAALSLLMEEFHEPKNMFCLKRIRPLTAFPI